MNTIASPQRTANISRTRSEIQRRGAVLVKPNFGATLRHVGHDALDLLHRLTTNSLLDMQDGAARRTVLTNEKGRIVDVLWIVKLSDAELLLVSDAPKPDATLNAIERYTIIEDAELTDASDDIERWYITGTNATEILCEHFSQPQPVESGIGSILDLTPDADGFAIALRTDAAGPETWQILATSDPFQPHSLDDQLGIENHPVDAQKGTNPLPIDAEGENNLLPLDAQGGIKGGLDSPIHIESPEKTRTPIELFHRRRIVNGVPIAGHELTDAVNPLEAGLISLVDFDKGCYIGQEVIARLDTYDKVQRCLIQFELTQDSSSRETLSNGDRILLPATGRNVGWITSFTHNPNDGNTIGLAYIRNAHSEIETVLSTEGSADIKILGISRTDT